MGLHAPAGTSQKVVARLQAEVAGVMREPAMAARMKQLGMVMEENVTAKLCAVHENTTWTVTRRL